MKKYAVSYLSACPGPNEFEGELNGYTFDWRVVPERP